jgi:excisionase family DNA binding protein
VAELEHQGVSDLGGYNEEYLSRLIRNGRIEAVKVGPAYLIRVGSLKAYMESQDPSDGRSGPRPRG